MKVRPLAAVNKQFKKGQIYSKAKSYNQRQSGLQELGAPTSVALDRKKPSRRGLFHGSQGAAVSTCEIRLHFKSGRLWLK
jgi:hypothetical protein